MRLITRSTAVAGLALSLAACGTLDRPDGPLRLNDPNAPISASLARTSVDARLTDFMKEFGTLMAEKPSLKVLSLSGGGANGAYGAGLIYGWSESSVRPTFDVVTGVSTGALAAPFAFLGPSWDEELKDAYTSPQTENLISFRSFAAAFNPSLFSSKRLDELVTGYVTPELLTAIAAEHAKGRRLLVATTNLDTQQTVIWDMGAIATEGGEDAKELFKDVLVASASIPGVFPPVLLPGMVGTGQIIAEMHVDGGVNVPYLAIPEELMLWTSPNPRTAASQLYVIVNGQAGRNFGTTRGSLSGILSRTYDSMSKASLRTHLALTASFSHRNNVEFSFTAIPDNVQASALAFDQETMTALFEVGRERGRDGSAWTRMDDSESHQTLIPDNKIAEEDIPEPLNAADDDTPETKPVEGNDAAVNTPSNPRSEPRL